MYIYIYNNNKTCTFISVIFLDTVLCVYIYSLRLRSHIARQTLTDWFLLNGHFHRSLILRTIVTSHCNILSYELVHTRHTVTHTMLLYFTSLNISDTSMTHRSHASLTQSHKVFINDTFYVPDIRAIFKSTVLALRQRHNISGIRIFHLATRTIEPVQCLRMHSLNIPDTFCYTYLRIPSLVPTYP